MAIVHLDLWFGPGELIKVIHEEMKQQTIIERKRT
jgi:hypothetical protein